MAEFVKVATVGEVPPGEMKIVELDGQEIVVANLGGEFVAFSNECTHRGGPLGEGELKGDVVECPWHGGQFNVRTGEVWGRHPRGPSPASRCRSRATRCGWRSPRRPVAGTPSFAVGRADMP